MFAPAVSRPVPDLGTHVVPAGTEIVRCHAHVWGSTEFNPEDGLARFRPVVDGKQVVPTIYGSDTMSGALCETVFHDVERVLEIAMQRNTVIVV